MRSSVHASVCSLLFVAAAVAAAPAHAEDIQVSDDVILSAYVEGVSDYRWRGLSASNGNFALQGSVSASHSSGFYAGAWASSIAEDEDNVYGSTELDLYAGWTGKVAAGLTADVGLYYYAYPGGHVGDANVVEPFAALSTTVGGVTGRVGVAYAWKQDALGGQDNLYLSTDISTEVPSLPLTLSAHVGYTDGAWSPNLLTEKSESGGFDYTVGASYQINEFLSVGASYVGVDGYSQDGYTNDTVVGSLRLSL